MASEMRYPVAAQIDVGVNRVEDRVVAVARTRDDDRRAALLTRRMLARLLAQADRALRGTESAAGRAPADQADEILHMEHLAAVREVEGIDQVGEHGEQSGESSPSGGEQGAQGGESGGEGRVGRPNCAFLVTEITVERRGEQLVLAILGHRRNPLGVDGGSAEAVYAIALERPTAHRFLGLLKQTARSLEWGLDDIMPWMDAEPRVGTRAVN